VKNLVVVLENLGIFILACLILFISNSILKSVKITKQGEFFVQHDFIIRAIQNYIASHGKVPNTLEELNLAQYEDIVNYYPESWSKPGKILLESQFMDFYFVTFGNDDYAVVKSYCICKRDSSGYIRTNCILKSNWFYEVQLPLWSFLCLIFALFSTWIAIYFIKKRRTASKVVS